MQSTKQFALQRCNGTANERATIGRLANLLGLCDCRKRQKRESSSTYQLSTSTLRPQSDCLETFSPAPTSQIQQKQLQGTWIQRITCDVPHRSGLICLHWRDSATSAQRQLNLGVTGMAGKNLPFVLRASMFTIQGTTRLVCDVQSGCMSGMEGCEVGCEVEARDGLRSEAVREGCRTASFRAQPRLAE